jgi:hypothetical protein
MAITTASQSQIGQETAKNSQIVTTSVRLINSGGGAAAGPNITSIIVTDSEYNNLDDTAAATSNSYIKILGTGFQSTANVFLNGTMVPKANVTFISSTELRAVLPVSNTGNYAVSVYNSNSAGALYSSSFVISTMPQWLTSATLANVVSNTVFSNTLVATSDSSVTYSNTTIMPTNTTLLSNGYYFGNISVGSATNFTFGVRATDLELQDALRTFTLPVIRTRVPEFSSELSVGYTRTSGGATASTLTLANPGVPGGGAWSPASFYLAIEWTYNNNTTIPTYVAPSGLTGWSDATGSNSLTAGVRMSTYYRRATASDAGANITLNNSGSNKRGAVFVFREINGLTNWIINPNTGLDISNITCTPSTVSTSGGSIIQNGSPRPVIPFLAFGTNNTTGSGINPTITGAAAPINVSPAGYENTFNARAWVYNLGVNSGSIDFSQNDGGVNGVCFGKINIDPTPI